MGQRIKTSSEIFNSPAFKKLWAEMLLDARVRLTPLVSKKPSKAIHKAAKTK